MDNAGSSVGMGFPRVVPVRNPHAPTTMLHCRCVPTRRPMYSDELKVGYCCGGEVPSTIPVTAHVCPNAVHLRTCDHSKEVQTVSQAASCTVCHNGSIPKQLSGFHAVGRRALVHGVLLRAGLLVEGAAQERPQPRSHLPAQGHSSLPHKGKHVVTNNSTSCNTSRCTHGHAYTRPSRPTLPGGAGLRCPAAVITPAPCHTTHPQSARPQPS